MSKFVGYVFSTGGLVTALLLCVAWTWLRPLSKAARWFLVLCIASYAAASTYIVPATIALVLTRGYQPFEPNHVAPGHNAIVLLGASSFTIQGWGSRVLSLPNEAEAARVLEAYRVYELIHPDWIISSSGPTSLPGAQPDSVVMRDALVQLGVPAERIVLESTSRTTSEQVSLVMPILRSLKIDQVVLVTSDIHMRRSIGAFRSYGVRPVPAVAPNVHYKGPWHTRYLPSEDGLSYSSNLVHEFLGIAAYWIRGDWRPPI